MVAIIILLYITTTINFFFNGPFLAATNVEGSTVTLDFFRGSIQDHAIVILVPSWGWTQRTDIGIGAAAVMSTVVADCIMVCATPAANIDVNVVLCQF